ncbi:MAG: Na+/H+ antiporter subunit E [Candidatus Margulisbacteria bacterium]|nr:Na+/H+ antiporter subunit E [Candidatus Margulisiibacteriota bacterium]
MRYLTTFIFLLGFWILLSGKFDVFHLVLGVISSSLVAYASRDLLFNDTEFGLMKRLKFSIKFVRFFLWLNWEIILANFHVIYLVCHPNMKSLINPQIVRFRTSISDEFGKFMFANSITLTPGTITIDLNDDELLVHALTDKTAQGISEDMERHISRVFE